MYEGIVALADSQIKLTKVFWCKTPDAKVFWYHSALDNSKHKYTFTRKYIEWLVPSIRMPCE
jgi:hypothetical protein